MLRSPKARRKLSALTCGATPSNEAVTLSVAPSVGQITLGSVNTSTLNNFSQPEATSPAVLLNLLLIQATATSTVNLGGLAWQSVQFSASDITRGTVKSVQTNNIAQATVTSPLRQHPGVGATRGGWGPHRGRTGDKCVAKHPDVGCCAVGSDSGWVGKPIGRQAW